MNQLNVSPVPPFGAKNGTGQGRDQWSVVDVLKEADALF